MTLTLAHTRCMLGATIGVLLALAVQAWAQVPPSPVAVDPTAELISRLLSGGGQLGLPAVLAGLGWLLGRGGLVLTVRLHDDDRKLLRALRRREPERDESSEGGTT